MLTLNLMKNAGGNQMRRSKITSRQAKSREFKFLKATHAPLPERIPQEGKQQEASYLQRSHVPRKEVYPNV